MPPTMLVILAAVVAMLVIVPDLVARRRPRGATLLNAVLPALAMMMSAPTLAYGLLGAASVAMAIQIRAHAPTGARMLALAAAATLPCAFGFVAASGPSTLVFALSLVAIALRAGVIGLHAGVSSLCRAAPVIQAQQFSSLLALVVVHLRFVDQLPAAAAVAVPVVVVGALSALVFALLSLVQRDLDGLLRTSLLMHGGMLFAAVGAAGRGHHVAALFVALTMCLALAGLSLTVLALEARVGKVSLLQARGRARAFPRLAAAFGFFGAAGVGMPGTAGFIADDLILHALWSESVVATVAVTFSSALLAVATLRAITRAFMGPVVGSVAPDLTARERSIALLLIFILLGVGLLPQLVVGASTGLFEGG